MVHYLYIFYKPFTSLISWAAIQTRWIIITERTRKPFRKRVKGCETATSLPQPSKLIWRLRAEIDLGIRYHQAARELALLAGGVDHARHTLANNLRPEANIALDTQLSAIP